MQIGSTVAGYSPEGKMEIDICSNRMLTFDLCLYFDKKKVQTVISHFSSYRFVIMMEYFMAFQGSKLGIYVLKC